MICLNWHGFYDENTTQRARALQEKGWYSYTGTDLHNKRYTDFYDSILSRREVMNIITV